MSNSTTTPENCDDDSALILNEVEETPESKDVDKKIGNLTELQLNNENKQFNDIFHSSKNMIEYPSSSDINTEFDEYIVKKQKQIDNEFVDDMSSSTPLDVKNTHLLQNMNELNGYLTKNNGQVDNDSVRFYIQGNGVWFMDDGVVFEIVDKQKDQNLIERGFDFDPLNFNSNYNQPITQKSVVIKLNFKNSNIVRSQGRGLLSHKSNFFYGNDSSKWCTNVPNYREIIYENLYDNIDLRFYIINNNLKYKVIVHPGGNINDIKLISEGPKKMQINISRDLLIHKTIQDIIGSNLFIYQNQSKTYNKNKDTFELIDSNDNKFSISNNYTTQKNLIIDSGLMFSTFIGTNNYEWGTDLNVDANGNTYIIGSTQSSSFPTTTGSYDTTHNGNDDIFVCKLNHNGSKLLYSTFIGGKSLDDARNIKIDSNNNSYVTGRTYSYDFPTTTSAYDTSFNRYSDIFIFKLNHKGSILKFSTFVGGNNTDHTISLKIDTSGNSYVTGLTNSNDFPTTINAYDKTYNGNGDVFVIKLNSLGTKLLYSSFIGGNNSDIGDDIEFDSKGNIYVTGVTNSTDFPISSKAFDKSHNGGYDVFILKLNLTNSSLIYSTFIGGGSYDCCYRIIVDHLGNAFISGPTSSSNFPTTVGAFDTSYNNNGDAYILKLNSNGSNLIYSTYIGGKVNDWSYDLEVDSFGNAIITGGTYSSDFPITSYAYDTTINGNTDIFVLKLNENGSKVINSTFIGGSLYEEGRGIVFDPNGNLYVTGLTESSDFPTTTGAYDTTFNGNYDCFVLKLALSEINNPPKITSFTATSAPEGSKVIFTVNASDPDNDTLTYSFDFQNDSIFEYVGKNNTTSFTWGDDYKGTAVVRVSDGNLSAEANTSVIVINVPPKIKDLKVENTTLISQNVTEEWIKRYNGPGNYNDYAQDIVIDSSGNVYVTGYSTGCGTGYDYTTVVYDSSGNELWVARYNGLGNGNDYAVSIALGVSGNVYVTGYSMGNGTGWDYATIAYDSFGNELWVVRYNGPSYFNDTAQDIAVDSSENVHVTGRSQGSGTDYDYTTIKYDMDGNEQWVKRYNGPVNESDMGNAIALDPNGNVYVAGNSRGNGTTNDYATVAYDSLGNELWVARYNGLGNRGDYAWAIALDSSGNVYVTGQSFGNGTNNDYVTIAYDSSGNELWVARYNGPNNSYDEASAIALDPSGNIYVTGASRGVGTNYDYATIKYDMFGNELWVIRYNGPGNGPDVAEAIALDSSGNIYVTGFSTSTWIVADFATVAYDSSGNELWVARYNGPGDFDDYAHAIALDSSGNVFVTGFSYGDGTEFDYCTIKYSPIDNYECYEGSSVPFIVNTTDPGSDDLTFTWNWGDESSPITTTYYNDGKGSDPYPSPNGIYPFFANDSINHTYPDDGIYNITLMITDDDGLSSSFKTKIIVKNVAPKINISVIKTEIDKKQSANLSVRIAGEKWHDVRVELLKNGKNITNGSLIRYPGNPNKQMLHFLNHTIDSSANWTAVLRYTPENDPVNGKPNGATPCWVILNLSNGKQIKLHHTFKVKHKDTHIWIVNLTKALPSSSNNTNTTFIITINDPGADDITLKLDFGDGTNITAFYPNNNQTYPVSINVTLFHNYLSSGALTVTLLVKDDDGGVTTVKANIDLG